jgi:hypothetical protein
MNPFGSSSINTTTPAIDTPSTGFTSAAGWLAGISAVITALGTGLLTLLQNANVVSLSEPVKVALIGFVGVGILAYAIAAAGDSLARAYAVAHVTRIEGKDNQPALQTAAFRLADAYAAAHGLKLSTPANTADGEASATTTSVYAPSSPAASKESCLELSPPLKVQVRGKDAQATAILVSSESGKETQRYLVGLPGSPLTWVNSDAISMPDAAPAAQLPSPTASQESCLELSPPLKVKVGAKDGEAIAVKIKNEGGKETQRYLVGTPGSRYVWEAEDAISMRMS